MNFIVGTVTLSFQNEEVYFPW